MGSKISGIVLICIILLVTFNLDVTLGTQDPGKQPTKTCTAYIDRPPCTDDFCAKNCPNYTNNAPVISSVCELPKKYRCICTFKCYAPPPLSPENSFSYNN
ncbi:unnamed protein product [Cuscuta epithymum]|uniref:Uncharacterized protein n=1 Tax=Cuscuta epithymum TaxID=186058 RepID=A0AAV0EX43_9ASTE|nr:unnamed protein product [Cuscuta epithymum]